ncbi:tRNA wybutosine-synthesizing protein 4 [Angomonas deanei]|nr:tRNA wybutosine-synthesizing protein 4 [Angomonas deanei]|eukprot:EPY25228.1 tRNA wybutosine-synthesizing protein 4 [Angomonas deanei]
MSLQKTARSACSRKVHCVSKKYLDDPFVAFFAKDDTIVNSPLMNRGTWLRTTAIEQCVLSFFEQCNSVPIQVISYGAGVDTLFFRLKKDHPSVLLEKYVEIDFADLVEEKRKVIEKNTIFQQYVTDDVYQLFSSDLRQPKEVIGQLKKHIKPNVPTIILAEMVFVYIEESITSELLKLSLDDLLNGGKPVEFISYDSMQPNDRFGEMMVENLSNIGAELKGIHSLPDPPSHEKRALSIGFEHAKCVSMKKLYLSVPQSVTTHLNKLEMIDDWDEWNLVHDHYCFLIATTKIDVPKIFSAP